MLEVIEDEAVAAFLDHLWEQGREHLVIKVGDAETWIATGDARARRHRLEAPVLAWAVWVTDQGQDWLIIWSETAPGVAKIHAFAQTDLL